MRACLFLALATSDTSALLTKRTERKKERKKKKKKDREPLFTAAENIRIIRTQRVSNYESFSVVCSVQNPRFLRKHANRSQSRCHRADFTEGSKRTRAPPRARCEEEKIGTRMREQERCAWRNARTGERAREIGRTAGEEGRGGRGGEGGGEGRHEEHCPRLATEKAKLANECRARTGFRGYRYMSSAKTMITTTATTTTTTTTTTRMAATMTEVEAEAASTTQVTQRGGEKKIPFSKALFREGSARCRGIGIRRRKSRLYTLTTARRSQ